MTLSKPFGPWGVDEECYYGIYDHTGALVEAGTDQNPELN